MTKKEKDEVKKIFRQLPPGVSFSCITEHTVHANSLKHSVLAVSARLASILLTSVRIWGVTANLWNPSSKIKSTSKSFEANRSAVRPHLSINP
jgi:predicted neutral ceramidase superfamily lipid hydrolase